MRVIVLLTVLCLVSSPCRAAAVLGGFDAQDLGRTDDGSTAAVPLGFEIDLFGQRVSQVYVNNNGNLSFDGPVNAYTPEPLPQLQRQVIAAFFADVDSSFNGATTRYGQGSFNGRPAFGATWVDVAHYSGFSPASARNSFQALIVDRSDRAAGDFDLVFNYDRIQWEAGTASGGNSNGLGGTAARAGFALGRGQPGSWFELQGSAVNSSLLDGGSQALVGGRRGSEVAGRYVFELRTDSRAQVSTLTPFAAADAEAAVSDDSGRQVFFESADNTLAAGDENSGRDILRYDTLTGEYEVISVDSEGGPLTGHSRAPAVSGDGRTVVFVGPDDGIYLRNLATGSTQRIADGRPGGGSQPRISSHGRRVVYVGRSSDPAQGNVEQDNIFLIELQPENGDLLAGEPRCLSCKAVDAEGNDTATDVNGAAATPDIDGDGSRVVWASTAGNARAGSAAACPNVASRVLARDLDNGQVSELAVPGQGGSCGAGGGASAPRIDRAGQRVAFVSDQALLAGDSNGTSDAYLREWDAGLQRISVAADGLQGNAAAVDAAISGDGEVVAFASTASNLGGAGNDSNAAIDLFVKAVESGELQRLALNERAGEAASGGRRPALNFDASRISFEAQAADLAPGSVANRSQVYQRRNPVASPILRSATWWRPSEAGWGLFIFDQGDVLAPAWFTYDSDGEPTWFLAAGAFPQADGSYTGDLFRFTGAPFDRIQGPAITSETQIGNIRLAFGDDDSLEFEYEVGSLPAQQKQLSRFPFGDRTLACRPSPTPSRAAASNYSDMWYDPASSGWGLFINQVDQTLVAIWYTYDSDGEPVFFVITASPEAPSQNRFSGIVYRQPDGTPFSEINDMEPSGEAIEIGTASFEFSDGENGSFRYTIGSVEQSKPITRLQVGSVPTVCESVPAAGG